MKESGSCSEEVYDVAIIGGGPAGSVAGAVLAKAGRRVVIYEKEKFPRFHIGESLLPNGNGILKEIGVWEKIAAAGFIEKYAGEFTVPDRSQSVRNEFSKGLVPGLEMSYQVERSRFDEILLRHAEELGCVVHEECGVRSTAQSESGEWEIEVGEEAGRVRTRWVIDASGRTSVMGRRLKLAKETIPYPGRFAVFNHYKGFPRAEGKQGGDIIILRLEDAWFWVIPISSTVTSIGVVAQKGARNGKSLQDFFDTQVARSSWLHEAMEGCEATGECRIESDYCFAFDAFGRDRVLLAGDAASFIDPVFSSGVYLALESGRLSAQMIDQALNDSTKEECIYASYTSVMKEHVSGMRRLIETFYDNKRFEVFMTPKPILKIPQAVNSILAGCSLPPFAVRWRFWLFQKICELHKKRTFVAPFDWSEFDNKEDVGS